MASTPAPGTFSQFGRKYQLVVQSEAGEIDLSHMRFRFKVNSSDVRSPNNAEITITNLSDNTTNQIQNEFTKVRLAAGYQHGAYGTIFSGDICQIGRGKENATDKFLRIVAADGDAAHNFAIINKSLVKGSKPMAVVSALAAAMAPFGVTMGQIQGLADYALPRGKVMYGMVRDYLDDLCKTNGTTWSIQNGALTILPNGGSASDQAPIVLNSQTGMVGIPTQTEGGVKVRCLLNPNIVIGSTLQLNNSDIAQTINVNPIASTGGFTIGKNAKTIGGAGAAPLPNLSSDGFYRVMAIEATGDTRGNDWFYDMITIGTGASLGTTAGFQKFGPLGNNGAPASPPPPAG